MLDELINEKLKVREAKKWGLEIPSSEVDSAYATMASRMRLTPPEVTKFGIEMFAICAKKESAADNSPVRRQVRESIMAERYEQRSKQYLQELRRGAMFEYK